MTRRARAFALAVVFTFTACAGDGSPTATDGAVTSSTTTTDGSGSPGVGSTPGGPGPSPGTGQDEPTDTTPDTSAGPAPTVTTAVPEPGAVGTYGRYYLSSSESRQLVVEVLSQSGAEPAAGTVEQVVATLAAATDKPVSAAASGLAGGTREWTPDALVEAAEAAGGDQSRDVARLRLLFVHGSLQGDDGVIGVAVRSDVAAVFIDKVHQSGGVLGDSTAVERAVTVHEIGHILGLVDLVLDTGREDPDHPGHSSNPDSVMYWAVESTLVGQVLGENPPSEFDSEDRADLARIRDSG